VHPALSVIFFTTLSGAGYGLLAWAGLWPLLLADDGGPNADARQLLLWCVGLGAALVTAGFLASLAHLGQLLRTWRALSQWRSSWMSREGALALLCYLPAAAMAALLWLDPERAAGPPWLLPACGALLAVCALATVWATGMIYASLRTIPAWSMKSVPAIYLMFALGTGMALLLALAAARLGLPPDARLAWPLAAQGALLVAIKLLYWRRIDRQPLPQSRGDAVGLPGRAVNVFERPHTEANYITREMAFRIARQHAGWLRLLAGSLLLGGPLLAAGLLLAGLASAPVALGAAAVLMLAGAFVERWLFFAQARHMVTLYY
jgi:DMSO reductase anchor subunit